MISRRSLFRFVLLAATMGLGCGGPARVSTTAPAAVEPDPTERICHPAPTLGPTARARIDAASEARQRGCPREALLGLASLPSPTEDERNEATFVALEAREDVLANGFDDLAPPSVFRDAIVAPWVLAGLADKSELDVAIDLAKVAPNGKLGPAFTDGRFGRAAVRAVPTYGCGRTVTGAGDDKIRGIGADAIVRLLQAGAIAPAVPGSPGFQRTVARGALWACETRGLSDLYARAAASARENARPDLVEDAILTGFETLAFSTRRAGDFELPEILPSQMVAAAARDEAAKQGVGIGATNARQLEDGLGEALPQLSKVGAVRAAWMTSVATLRLRGDARSAIAQARDVEARAVAVGRADLLDAARMVHLLAAVDLDDAAETSRIATLLTKSLVARGAIGALERAATLLVNAANRYAVSGRAEAAVTSTRAADRVATELPLYPSFKIRAQVPRLLVALGRTEEAREVHEGVMRTFGPRLGELPGGIGPGLAKLLEANGRMLRSELGDEPTDDTTGALHAAIATGNPRAFEQFVHGAANVDERHERVLVAATIACGAVRGELRATADHVAAVLRDLAATRPLDAGPGTDPEALAAIQTSKAVLTVEGPEMASAIARCGVALGDKALLARGRDILALASGLFGPTTIDPDQAMLHETYAAEADGRHALAAQRYLELGRKVYARTGASAVAGIGAGTRSSFLFESAAKAAIHAGDLGLAVAILEESRGRDLRAIRTQSRAATNDAGALGPLASIERKVADEQARARALAQLAAAATPDERRAIGRSLDDVRSRMATLERERDAEAREIASKNPAAYRAAALAPPKNAREIQAALGPDEVVVYLGLGMNDPVAVVLDATSVREVALGDTTGDGRRSGVALGLAIAAFDRGVGDRIRGSSRGLRLEGADADATGLGAARREVYRKLVAPLESIVPPGKRLVIVPDASTGTLPFAEIGDGVPLVERNPLRIVAGAFMLEGRGAARAKVDANDVLVVGDPAFGDAAARTRGTRGIAATGAWRALPGTRAEATAVASGYGATPILGADATESALLGALAKKRVVHLATHGFADVARPAYSALVLAKPTRAGDDGLLHAFEVERLHLDADVVVLSACETGRGQRRGTEGTLALDRAFLAAGARSVVSSLWLVDDDATAVLMTKLHERLRAGDPADVALRAAMLDVKARRGFANPHYWSAFRVVGGGSR